MYELISVPIPLSTSAWQIARYCLTALIFSWRFLYLVLASPILTLVISASAFTSVLIRFLYSVQAVFITVLASSNLPLLALSLVRYLDVIILLTWSTTAATSLLAWFNKSVSLAFSEESITPSLANSLNLSLRPGSVVALISLIFLFTLSILSLSSLLPI